MAEWLGRGLQNLVRRFDSVWYLKKDITHRGVFFYLKLIIMTHNTTNSKLSENLNIIWLIAMIIYVQTVAMCLNFDVFMPRIIVVMITWTILLISPYVIFRKKYLYIGATSILFLDGLINLFHWIILKCPLNASSIFVFMNTNFSEASEFMSVKMSPLLLLVIPYMFLYIMTLRHTPNISLKSKKNVIVWSVLWIYMIAFFADNIINDRFVRLAVPDVERAFISFLNESKAYKSLKNRELYDLNAQIETQDSTLVVMIIGESCNRNHMSLYGYHRETSPQLSSRNDIMVFDNVISCNSSTLLSIMNFLTENNIEKSKAVDSCINVFDVFHSASYKTYWLSNQSPIGLWDNGVTSLAQNADKNVFVNLMASSSMESTQMASYDENLIEPLQNSLMDGDKNKLIMIHLMGSHTQYNKRYPDKFKMFGSNSEGKDKVIDAYDNSILYNDFVIDSFFTILENYSERHPNVRISALYFSDHGENVYDEGDYAGHDYSGNIPRANVEIPFIFWFSESQIDYLRNEGNFIERDLHTPYMIDDLFHTIIDLSDVKTDCFEPQRSFVNNYYNSTRKRILENWNEY